MDFTKSTIADLSYPPASLTRFSSTTNSLALASGSGQAGYGSGSSNIARMAGKGGKASVTLARPI